MAARAPSFKFKTEPATLGGEGSDGDGSKEVDRLKQELEMAEYGRQSAKRHVEDLRSEIKELMREVSKLKEDNTTLQQQREEAIQRERQLKQQLEEEQQEQQDRVSNSGSLDYNLQCCSVAYTSEGDEMSLLWIDPPTLSPQKLVPMLLLPQNWPQYRTPATTRKWTVNSTITLRQDATMKL